MATLGINPFFFLLISLPASMLIIPLAWKLAPILGMIDKPDPRKVHLRPIPRVGGLGIVIGSLLPVITALKFDLVVQAFVAGSLILFLFGMWDDAKQISHWFKFIGQFAAACTVVYYGQLYVADWPFLGDSLPSAYSKAFTVVALMGMINAINHSDGLDGLAAGESMLSLIAIASLGYIASDNLLVALAFSIVGGIIGFLRFNTHPAEVFMGDAGSQFLGFALGVLAIYVTQIALPAMSAALPLLFLGLPIADILVVLYKRINGKMNWFKATRNHVHHRLLDLGFDHYETVVIIYSVQALAVILAVLMRYQSDSMVTLAYFFIVGTLFGALSIAEARTWHRQALGASWLATGVEHLKSNMLLKKSPLLLISLLLPFLLVTGALLPTEVSRDFGVVSGVLGLLIAFDLVLNRIQGSPTTRLSAYAAAIFSSYLFSSYPPASDLPLWTISVVLIAVLAIAVGVYIRYTSEHRFGATPTDYLIVFGVLAVAVFGGTDVSAREPVQAIMYSVVLLYSCEAMLGDIKGRWSSLAVGTVVCLSILAVRGLT